MALPPERPAVFALRLLPVLDSGGVLSLELQLNAVLFVEGREAALSIPLTFESICLNCS